MSKNSNYIGKDCLGNSINQLGTNNTSNPSLSEISFNSRYSLGRTAVGGGNHNSCDECECDCNCPSSSCDSSCDCCSMESMGGGPDCGCTREQEAGGYYVGVEKSVGGLPEIVPYFDCNKPDYAPRDASPAVKPGFNNSQKAGAIIYNYITNPITGRKVNINGKIGKKVLLNYLHQSGGMRSLDTAFTGAESILDTNMSNREFGCRQPQWDPKCV
jgi:hypothetical protein